MPNKVSLALLRHHRNLIETLFCRLSSLFSPKTPTCLETPLFETHLTPFWYEVDTLFSLYADPHNILNILTLDYCLTYDILHYLILLSA